MRSIGLVAAITLITGCESPDRQNESGASSEQNVGGAVAANEAVAAPAENATNAVEPAAEAKADPASPCLIQGEQRLEVKPIRAVGTEPFWSARVEGRCVTYSTPEDQEGARVWARYSAEGSGGSWIGQLGGRRFELRTRSEAGCSDGMSDKGYPIAVELTVGGEQRRGCAEPL